MLTTINGLEDYEVIIEALRKLSIDPSATEPQRKRAGRLMVAHRAVYKAALKDPAPGAREISQKLVP